MGKAAGEINEEQTFATSRKMGGPWRSSLADDSVARTASAAPAELTAQRAMNVRRSTDWMGLVAMGGCLFRDRTGSIDVAEFV
jgi:hypothetical protein